YWARGLGLSAPGVGRLRPRPAHVARRRRSREEITCKQRVLPSGSRRTGPGPSPVAGGAPASGWGGAGGRGSLPVLKGQRDDEDGPSRTLGSCTIAHRQLAVVCGDDAACDVETQPRARDLPLALTQSREGVKDALHIFLRDACSVVGDADIG